MTDLDKVKALFDELGIGYTHELTANPEYSPCAQWLELYEGDAKIGGYSCFFTTFEFDRNGNFIKVGAWE